MMVTTKGRYAMRVMLDLCQHQDSGFVSLKDISERQEISVKYLEAIISRLSKAGLVQSLRGKSGGYMLTREPKEYTVREILSTAQGPIAPVNCLTDGENGCPRSDHCITLPLWLRLDEVINEYFDRVTLADVLNGDVE